MSTERWSGVLARITKMDADDIDEAIGSFDARRAPTGRPILPADMPPLMPQAPFKASDQACIGVRITQARTDTADLAAHLTTLALEKEVEIIVLSHLPYSGLERFGLRCERVVGETQEARDVCEDQILRFWGIDIVI